MDVKEVGARGGRKTFSKYGKEHYKKLAGSSIKTRFGSMTPEQRSEYMKKVRSGKPPK